MPLNIAIAGYELQAAITTKLTGDSAHMALIGSRFYDHVPDTVDDASFPFENVSSVTETWADSFDTGFRAVTLQLDVWSRYHGRKEAYGIQSSQIALLNRKQDVISLATLHLVSIRMDYSDVLEDPDGLTWHGVTRYLALVQATN